tara:strand:- start:2736 stop:3002 length:267 start_codon:yes stop_codon:yes gene_type:complete
MIQAIIIKQVLKVVFKKIETKHKLNKLKKYVEEENELDIQVKQIQKTMNKFAKNMEEIEKNIAILKADSHPKREFVKCNDCKCKIKEK